MIAFALMDAVALAMKSASPSLLSSPRKAVTVAPTTDPDFVVGVDPFTGPAGTTPPRLTVSWRAAASVWMKLRNAAAAAGCAALDGTATVSVDVIAAYFPPDDFGGKRKKPNF